MDRRDFIRGAGIGAVSLGTSSVSELFGMNRKIIGVNDRIRIGLIGAGDRGQQDLKDALKQPNIECVAVADVYSRRRDQVKSYLPNIDTYDDARRLLDRQDIDGVINATPQHLHSKYILAALEAKKDIYSEKTMAWDISEALACRDAVKKSPQIVQIGMQDESSGDLADTRKFIEDGKLGKITMVESWMSRNTPIGKGEWVRPVPSDCNPDHVNWNLFLGDRPKAQFDGYKFINWRLFWEFSGGNITENMVHQIGFIISAMNLELPSAATMMGGVYSVKDGRQVPDTINVALEYPNDLLVVWQSTFSNDQFGMGEHYLGNKGTVEHSNGGGVKVKDVHQEDNCGDCGVTYFPQKINNPNGVMQRGENPGGNHMANWFACMRDRKQPNGNVEIGYRSAVACHMANLAYKQKRRVTQEEAMAAKPEEWM